MRETRLSGSEGGGFEFNRFSLPLSFDWVAHTWIGMYASLPVGDRLRRCRSGGSSVLAMDRLLHSVARQRPRSHT